jgi:predicted P-loop ATPase
MNYVSSHPSTSSYHERKLTSTKRRRNQYTDIDSLNENDNEIQTIENDEEVAGGSELAENQNRLGNRGAQSWNSLRAVVRYYCSLRKIKRQ